MAGWEEVLVVVSMVHSHATRDSSYISHATRDPAISVQAVEKHEASLAMRGKRERTTNLGIPAAPHLILGKWPVKIDYIGKGAE